MMTENNFFTLCQKWRGFSQNAKIPKFYRQNIDLRNKVFVPYDELEYVSKSVPLERLIPHFFIEDAKQVNFACNPDGHSELLDKVYAVFSTDFSVFTNTYPQFNNALLLLNRLIASYWQQKDRFVVITLSWAGKETFETAFSNIEKGSVVGISTEGVSDWICFKNGFLEMLKVVEPSVICWHGRILKWVSEYFSKEKIIQIQKRFKILHTRELAKENVLYGKLF